MNRLELEFNNPDHRVGIAAYADHMCDNEMFAELQKHDLVDNEIVKMFQENQELKMQNEALKKEIAKIIDTEKDLDMVQCKVNNVINPQDLS